MTKTYLKKISVIMKKINVFITMLLYSMYIYIYISMLYNVNNSQLYIMPYVHWRMASNKYHRRLERCIHIGPITFQCHFDFNIYQYITWASAPKFIFNWIVTHRMVKYTLQFFSQNVAHQYTYSIKLTICFKWWQRNWLN